MPKGEELGYDVGAIIIMISMTRSAYNSPNTKYLQKQFYTISTQITYCDVFFPAVQQSVVFLNTQKLNHRGRQLELFRNHSGIKWGNMTSFQVFVWK